MRGIVALFCALALAKADPVRTNIASYDETDPKQAATICATDNSDDILVAHENCNQFYQCWDGIPIARDCYGNLHYNPTTQICDWPDKVDCGGRLIPQDVGTNENENEVSEEDDHSGNGGSGAGNCDPSQAGSICAQAGSDGTFVAHENCNKYYICDNGSPVVQSCPGNLLFDPFKDYCDWPERVDCGDRVICEESEENNSDTDNGSNDNSGNGGTGAGNCDPSQAGSICAQVGSDGTFVAHENCNKYYICDNGSPVVQRCPGNLLFDPFKDYCDWPERVDCGDRVICEDSEENNSDTDNESNDNSGNGSTGAGNCDPSQAGNICAAEGSDGVLVAHEICNKYYICSHGVPTVQRCPGTLLFDPFKDYCDWPDNVDCGNRVISEPDTDSKENEVSDNGDSDNAGTGTCNCKPGEAPSICAVDGSDNTLIAHENCNQFYTCAAGQPVTLNCPGTLLYNPYTEQCDWPENVDCGERVIPEVNDEEDNSGNGENGSENEGSDNNGSGNGDSDSGGTGTCNCNPGEAPSICAVDGSDNTLVAHENCNQFYTCAAGQPVTLTCPGTLLYNPYTEQCDWPKNVDCGERIIPEVNDEEDNNGNGENGTENGGSDSGDSDNESTGTCNCNPGEAQSICAVDGSDNTLVAHENCNQFYTCAAGQPVTLTCPGTLLYNPYTEQCDWPENVDCGERVIPEVNDEEDNNGNEENGSENEGSDNNGSGNGDSNNGGSDNGGTGTCNCNPGEAPSICAVDGSDNNLVAHENCNQFYTCAAGQPVTLTCLGTLLYNPYTEQCDWPENVDCGERVIPEVNDEEDNSGNGENGSENEGSDNNGSGNGDSNNSGSDNGGTGTCNCNPGEAPSICAVDGSDNTLVAHENCNQFYTCAAGQPVTLTCPGTLLYNPYTEQCDWPENVDCGERVIPEVNDEEGNNGNGENGSENGGSDNNGSGNGDSNNGGSDNGGTGTCNCNPGEAPSICAVDGSDNTLVAHENCNQFYTCAAGQPVTLTCPGTLLYNPYTEQCDWPENVDCGERVIPEVNDEEDNSGNGENGSENDGSDNNGSGNGDSDNEGTGTCNCNPGEAPSICAVDGSDNTLVAHETCNQFYTCAAGQPVTLTCPGTLLYNPYTEQCDWPENVDCGERVIPEVNDEEDNSGNGENGSENDGSDNNGSVNGDSNNGGTGTCNCNPGEAPSICAVEGSDNTLVAHENCNQFYTCAAGQPVTLTCPGNLLYNPYTEQCDWPENVDCGERVIPEVNDEVDNNGNGENGSENEGSDNNGSGNGDSNNGGSDNGDTGTCNCNPGEAQSICAVDGSDNTLVAHENCNQFYTCAAGQPVTLTCPGTLLYNPYTEQCDWPENVDCGERVIPEVNDEEDNSGNGENSSENEGSDNNGSGNGDSDNGGTGTCNCNPGEAPSICAVDGSDNTLVAHENCNQFYTCAAGQPVTLTCPGTLLYNPYTEQCDWPENVDCGERVIPEVNDEEDNSGNGENSSENEGSDNNGSGNGDSDNGGTGTCNCNPGEAPSICAVDGSDNTLVAHENCNQFYTCAAGQPVTLTCPGTLLYNPYTEQCDWPENVDCGERVIPEVNDEEDNSGNGENGSENEGSDNNGSGNGDSNNGDSDNGGTGTCNCNPGEAPAICAADGSDGKFVAHENCNQFYTCAAGQAVTLTCPGTLLYNPYTEQCDWPENVDCGERVIPDVNTEEDDSGNGETDTEDSENEGSDNGDTGTCNCNPGEAPAICAADGSDGTFVAHKNCNQFYTCVAGQPVTLTCAGSTLYNPYTQQCDWPENVDCGERVVPDVNTEEDDSGNGETDTEESENEGSDNGDSDNGDSDNGDSDNGDSDNGDTGTCNCNPGEAPAICAIDGSDGIFVAHENCNQFYTCVAGQPVTLTCAGSTLYNPYTQQCDWPENVQCGDRVIPEEDCEEDDNGNEETDTSSESEGSDSGDSENGSSGSCNCNPSEAPSICAAEGSDGTFVAHENCNQFYTCVAGQPVALTCAGTTLYNLYTQQCDWPENVQCGERVIPEEDCEEEDNGNEETDNSSENEGSDSGDSENGSSGSCNCNPGEAPSICAADGSDGTFVAHENCNQFYTCVAGQPVALTCAGSTLYNPYTQQCDWPENVQCGERVIPEEDCEEEDNGNAETDNSSENEGSDSGDSENGGSGSCNCNPGEAPSICAADGSDGTFVAHENCNQFYTCVAGQPVALTCAGSTLYNPYTQQCDWPENVQCGERVIPEEDCEEDNVNEETDTDSSENEDSDSGGSGSYNCNPEEAPTICATDGSEGTLVAHENCNQFYTCVAGKPVTLTCPGSTLYNPYSQVCDWPENVVCGDRIIPGVECEDNSSANEEDENNGGSDNGVTDSENSSECGDIESSENGGNGDSDNEGSDIASSENDGTENENSSESGDLEIGSSENDGTENENSSETGDLDSSTENGDSEGSECGDSNSGNSSENEDLGNGSSENGENDSTETENSSESGDLDENDEDNNTTEESENEGVGSESSESDDSDISAPENEDSDSESGTDSCDYCNPNEAPGICAASGSDGIMVAHENCNQFYTCFAGQPITLTCTGTTLYNPHTQRCDWPDNVSCGERTSSGNKDEAENENSEYGNETNDNEAEVLITCAESNAEGLFLPHDKCNQFYVCIGSQPVVMSCTGNLLYSYEDKRCDLPENVDCGSRIISDESSEVTDVEADDVRVVDVQEDNEEETLTEQEDEFGYDAAVKRCAEVNSAGVMVPHEECHRFYICVAQRAVVFTCTSDNLYDTEMQQCNYPQNVNCGSRVLRTV